jgi:hypothetical protein
MPMLLEDLAEETSASNLRAADRLDQEARALDERRRAEVTREKVRQDAVESARQATSYALARVAQAEAAWQLALVSLRKEPALAGAEQLLRSLLKVFESGQRLVRAPRTLWQIAEQVGAAPEQLGELAAAEQRFDDLAAQARLGLEHRAADWQPADPERLALGLQLAGDGKTISADEARARFHRGRG